MARWFGLASAQGAMAHSDRARASQEVMDHWFDSEREDQMITARSDSREDVTPAGAADHWGNWKRADQPARR
jgi:hypothetical protein